MKYWIYLNGEVAGSYEPSELVRVSGFSKTSLVCPVEGNASERNWRHAGIFPEIVRALEIPVALGNASRGQPSPEDVSGGAPPRPPAAADYVTAFSTADKTALDPGEILEGATQRIFKHVTELMKELENRREERSLTLSLERNLAEIKQELQAARERIRTLEEQTALLPGFEDREQKLEEFLERARADVKFRDHRLKELNHEIEQLRGHLEDAKDLSKRSGHLLDENKKLKQLEEALHMQLSEKDLTLAKALGVIRRIEEELGHMLPERLAGITRDIRDSYESSIPSSTTTHPQAGTSPYSLARKGRGLGETLTTPPSPSSSPQRGEEETKNISHQSAIPKFPVTTDEGKIERPLPLPPEEGVVSMAPVWKVALNRLSDLLKWPFRADR